MFTGLEREREEIMWNTFAAGLQKVQEKLDSVLDDSQIEPVKDTTIIWS